MSTYSRRDFLGLAGAAGLGSLGLGLTMPKLLAGDLGSLAASTDYRAVVCLFLDGGLDHLHAVTPYDSPSFTALQQLRPQVLIRPRTDFLPLANADQGGRTLAFHPELVRMKQLYDRGILAYVSGVGELTRPTTRSEVMSGAYTLGRGVGSHNDGAAYANSLGYEGTQYGWGGLCLDSLTSLNPNPTLSSINLYDTIFASGRLNQRTQVSSRAEAENLWGLATLPSYGEGGLSAVMRQQVITKQRDRLMEDAGRSLANHIDRSAALAAQAFADSTAAVPEYTYPSGTPFYAGRDNDIARQFRTVARLMQQRTAIGVNRQIFNIGLRGFDTHGGSEQSLVPLLATIDSALGYFFDLLDGLGLTNQVTVVVNTEFGRSLNGNSDGTDHGWGGGWFVAGGAIRGGTVYGRIPIIDPQGPDFQTLNNPTLIPTIPTEQVGATIAKWFGVSSANIQSIFPRLSAFPTSDLGFYNTAFLPTSVAAKSTQDAVITGAASSTGAAQASGADAGTGTACGSGSAAGALAGILALCYDRFRGR